MGNLNEELRSYSTLEPLVLVQSVLDSPRPAAAISRCAANLAWTEHDGDGRAGMFTR